MNVTADNRRARIAIGATTFALLLLTALPLFLGKTEFIADDHGLILGNPAVTSFDLRAIWTRPLVADYFPVTFTSFALDYLVWGANVKWFHLVNIIIYGAIGVLVYNIGCRLASGPASFATDPPVSTNVSLAVYGATVAMLFHPLNVESVANVASRKELLFVLFGLAAFRCYLIPRKTVPVMAGVLICATLAQLSKGTGVIVPLLLLTGDLLRFRTRQDAGRRALLLGSCFAVAALIFRAQFAIAHKAGLVGSKQALSLASRIGAVVRTFDVMALKFIWPLDLCLDYDIPWPPGLPPFTEWLPLLLLVATLLYLAATRRYYPLLLLALVAIPLLPYLNIIPLQHTLQGQLVFYDHYLLLPLMTLAILLGHVQLQLPPRQGRAFLALLGVVTIICVCYDTRLYPLWKNREAQYRQIIAVSPQLPKTYLFLGDLYLEEQRYEEAQRVLTKIFTTKNWYPEFIDVYQSLGDAYAFAGEYQKGERNYRALLAVRKDARKTLQNLSSTLIAQQKYQEAGQVIDDLLRYYPDDPIGVNNRTLVKGHAPKP
jgi:tetratricopeptide (TPR) repeat protein